MSFNKYFRLGLAFFMIAILMMPLTTSQAEAQAPRTVKTGSQNGDVWDLQHRLILLGYDMKLDGNFGKATREAVVQFQKDRGLQKDGVAGHHTWKALKKTSISDHELEWMARAVHGEARGETYKGKVAVAAVIMNRLASKDFPDTIKGVIFEKDAFTAVNDGQINLQPDDEARRAVRDAVRGEDPTHDSLYYFNPDTATSAWIWSRAQTVKIGRHIFAR